MYKADPASFKWPGMAAFASCEVGKGMREAQSYSDLEAGALVAGQVPLEARDPIEKQLPVAPSKLGEALRTGNDAVYDDIYWQFLSYQACGLSDLQKAAREKQLPPEVLNDWQQIDEGKRSGNQEEVWEGNTGLLHFEQNTVLQKKVYDQDRRMWSAVTHFPYDRFGKIESSIPSDTGGFERFSPNGDIGNFRDRWRWIKGSMLPAWKKLDQDPARAERNGPVPQMMRRKGALCVILLLGISELSCRRNKEKRLEPAPIIEVWMGDSIHKIHGETWLKLRDGSESDLDGFDDPRTFILHFPSGRRIKLWSKGTILTQASGKVVNATLLPLSEPVGFKVAVARLNELLIKLNMNHDSEVQGRIRSWLTMPVSTTESYTDRVDFDPGFYLFFKIDAYVPQSTEKWAISFDFGKFTGAKS